MLMMMIAGRSENRRRDYGDDCRFLRQLPSESMTMMLMMLVLFVRDHLCKVLVRLAAAAILLFWTACLRKAAKMAQSCTLEGSCHKPAPLISPNGWRLLPASKRSSSASSSSYFGQKACPKDSIISIASFCFLSTDSKHHQHHLLFILHGRWCAT